MGRGEHTRSGCPRGEWGVREGLFRTIRARAAAQATVRLNCLSVDTERFGAACGFPLDSTSSIFCAGKSC